MVDDVDGDLGLKGAGSTVFGLFMRGSSLFLLPGFSVCSLCDGLRRGLKEI